MQSNEHILALIKGIGKILNTICTLYLSGKHRLYSRTTKVKICTHTGVSNHIVKQWNCILKLSDNEIKKTNIALITDLGNR